MAFLVYLHIASAFVSLGLLLTRGLMQINGQNWRAKKFLKILPHLMDTLLIISGVAVFFGFDMFLQNWLIAKFAFLLGYIFASAKFFSKKQARPKLIWFMLAIACFISTILVAYWH